MPILPEIQDTHYELEEFKNRETVENCFSVTDKLLDKRIAQQKRFDAKPLATGMCYYCGSIAWSRVNNSRTNLVDINLTVEQIPAIVYQKAMLSACKGAPQKW